LTSLREQPSRVRDMRRPPLSKRITSWQTSVNRQSIGVGFKPQHLADVIEGGHGLQFFEVHPENYMADGGPMLDALRRLRQSYPVSFHGVGLSLGSVEPIDAAHLERFACLVRRFEPAAVSEHLAWSTHGGTYYNDLLPIPYTRESLARVSERIDAVQSRLGVSILIENPSTYVQFRSSTFGEGEFLCELVKRTGCGLLLDVNNAYVSAVNHGADPRALIAAMPLKRVGEIHLAGFSRDSDGIGDDLLIDSHGSPVDEAVWGLYAWAVSQIGPVPTLLERDNDVPRFEILAEEANRARGFANAGLAAAPGTELWAQA
jgi:uncharacterized protein